MRVYSLKNNTLLKGGGIVRNSRQKGCGLLLSRDLGNSTTVGAGVVRAVPKKMDLSGLKTSLMTGGRVKKQFVNL